LVPWHIHATPFVCAGVRPSAPARAVAARAGGAGGAP
jgi:hypothetical protein